MTKRDLPRCRPDIIGVLSVLAAGAILGGTVVWMFL